MTNSLYHFTTAEFAQEVLSDPDYAYAETSDGTYGIGFYALDLAPEGRSRDDLRYDCFGDSRPDHPMDGVLILEADLAVPRFEQVDDHIWLQPQEPPRQPIGYMVTAVGIWDGAWSIEQI